MSDISNQFDFLTSGFEYIISNRKEKRSYLINQQNTLQSKFWFHEVFLVFIGHIKVVIGSQCQHSSEILLWCRRVMTSVILTTSYMAPIHNSEVCSMRFEWSVCQRRGSSWADGSKYNCTWRSRSFQYWGTPKTTDHYF